MGKTNTSSFTEADPSTIHDTGQGSNCTRGSNYFPSSGGWCWVEASGKGMNERCLHGHLVSQRKNCIQEDSKFTHRFGEMDKGKHGAEGLHMNLGKHYYMAAKPYEPSHVCSE